MNTSTESPHDRIGMKAFEDILEGQDWLSATLNSIGDAVMATSAEADPTILFMNPAAERMTGWSLEEAIGCEALQIFSNHKPEKP